MELVVGAFVELVVGGVVGDLVGALVGDLVGALVGDLVGALVGALVGDLVGDLVGPPGASQISQASGQAPLTGPRLQYLSRLSVNALCFFVIQEQPTSCP